MWFCHDLKFLFNEKNAFDNPHLALNASVEGFMAIKSKIKKLEKEGVIVPNPFDDSSYET